MSEANVKWLLIWKVFDSIYLFASHLQIDQGNKGLFRDCSGNSASRCVHNTRGQTNRKASSSQLQLMIDRKNG